MGWHANYIASFEISQSDAPASTDEVLRAFEALLNAAVVGKPLGKTGKSVARLKSMRLDPIPHEK